MHHAFFQVLNHIVPKHSCKKKKKKQNSNKKSPWVPLEPWTQRMLIVLWTSTIRCLGFVSETTVGEVGGNIGETRLGMSWSWVWVHRSSYIVSFLNKLERHLKCHQRFPLLTFCYMCTFYVYLPIIYISRITMNMFCNKPFHSKVHLVLFISLCFQFLTNIVTNSLAHASFLICIIADLKVCTFNILIHVAKLHFRKAEPIYTLTVPHSHI